MPRVLVSAVSNELKSYRTLVEQSPPKRAIEPVFQELFGLGDEAISVVKPEFEGRPNNLPEVGSLFKDLFVIVVCGLN